MIYDFELGITELKHKADSKVKVKIQLQLF